MYIVTFMYTGCSRNENLNFNNSSTNKEYKVRQAISLKGISQISDGVISKRAKILDNSCTGAILGQLFK